MEKRRVHKKEWVNDLNAKCGQVQEADLRKAAYKMVNLFSDAMAYKRHMKQLVSGGEASLRMIISLVEIEFENGVTDLDQESQKWTLLACRDICLRHELEKGLLERVENIIYRMGNSYEKTELLNLIGEQLAKRKRPRPEPAYAPKKRGRKGREKRQA